MFVNSGPQKNGEYKKFVPFSTIKYHELLNEEERVEIKTL